MEVVVESRRVSSRDEDARDVQGAAFVIIIVMGGLIATLLIALFSI